MTGRLGDLEYARGRERKRSLRYRLLRRAHEVDKAIEEFSELPVRDIIDLGTADARMLEIINRKYPGARCVGVELSGDLVEFGKAMFPHLRIIEGDVQSLDFPDGSFDVAVATALIEHLPDPGLFMREVKRVLRRGGIFVPTSPDPFWESIATRVGHLSKGQHHKVMDLPQLGRLAEGAGFAVVKAQKFMLSPVGMPFESAVERVLRRLRLDFMLANQLLVCRS
jgi:SAM-dependent methyltransferase